ncbi:hypothetical protein GBAR_LOCUS31210 [Geodia barretti]|uniref:Uncharacterized protein n=1 Tax=Geodia barretti TaxID=519541 RepID=A0AA35U0H9_GEOBA|nr:hypothetical protein GBAR_LOCUS31210 [Geodia barretti]
MTAGPLDQRGDADGEERARGAHHQDVSGADAPDAGGLEDGGGPTDEQRGEDAPGKVGFGLIGDAENDRHAQHDPPDDDGGGLDAGADGQQVGGMLVRLVADVFVKLCGGQEILSEYKCDVIAVSIGIVCNDAREVHDQALERLRQGDIRDAAEKAWCATKRATDALILALTGEEPETTAMTTEGLLELASRIRDAETLVGTLFYPN